MKKVLLVAVIIITLAFTVVDWVTVHMDDRVSIDFPVKPEKRETAEATVWATGENAEIKCIAILIDFSSRGLDSASLALLLEGKPFYDGFKASTMARLPGAVLVSEEITKLNGRHAYRITVDVPGGSGDTSRLYGMNVFIGSKLYSSTFYEERNNPQEVNRKKFFESFTTK